MVSFWPWGSNDTSPASFEKTLSALSAKITTTQAALDKTRASARRVRALWVLYLGFAYLVYAILQLIVVRYQNMGVAEWAGMAGGPIFIILTRKLIGAGYGFRTDSLSKRLKAQQEERAKTIQRLKDATKYDSTMELIEKYGGERKKESAANSKDGKKSQPVPPQHGAPNRTNRAPPPTANIQHRPPPAAPQGPGPAPTSPEPDSLAPGAEFAPNAFSHGQPPPPDPAQQQQQQQQAYTAGGPVETRWYDRIFDVLLGEDETAPKNRIVLICQSCRLVNGQAPPGTRSLGELGVWRCMACHAQNGEPDEGKRIVEEVLASSTASHQANEDAVEAETDKGAAEAVGVGGSGGGGGEKEASATGVEDKDGVKKRRGKK